MVLKGWTQGNALRKGHSSDSFVKMSGSCLSPSLTICPHFLTEVSCHNVSWPTEMLIKRTESSIQLPAGNWRLLQTTLEVSKRTFYNWSLLSDNPSWYLVQNPKPEERVSMHLDPGPEVNCVTQMFLVWNHEVRANYYRTCEYMCFHVWQHTVLWILYCTVVGFIHLPEWKKKPLDDVGNGRAFWKDLEAGYTHLLSPHSALTWADRECGLNLNFTEPASKQGGKGDFSCSRTVTPVGAGTLSGAQRQMY